MSSTGPTAAAVPDDSDVTGLLHLRAAGVGLVLDLTGGGLPRVLHWGRDLGDLDPDGLRSLALLSVPPVTSNTLDDVGDLSVLPEHSRGWYGTPGLTGSRVGADWSPRFETESATVRRDGDGTRLRVEAVDTVASLHVVLEVEMTPSGMVRLRASVSNVDDVTAYNVDGLVLALPVPSEADQLLDLAGGHTRERSPQRRPFDIGSRMRDSRRGRTGTDSTLLMVAGAEGFGFGHGEVWGVHVGWSGNHRTYAERLASGEAVLGGGELLLPGEVVLQPHETYRSPWLYASYGQGLDEMSHRIHQWLRSRPQHPTRHRPRPVTLNTWEAVYLDHDQARLFALADAAAEVGAERYVLDDGWFRGRRTDRTGLGDWWVDDTVYPEGLHPLVRHVQAHGLEFGLWVEPEMINPDSDLARSHPEWIMSTGGRDPVPSRYQQVLDLGNEQAYSYVLDRLDDLLTEYPISYLKWDHNRDLHDAGSKPAGRPGVHVQTQAVYRLMDELKRRHPGLEIESCSSGGGRVDLGIMMRADRIWASDSNDALERQRIERWTKLLLPPELIGSHIGPPQAHTTGRTQDLAFRAGTAFFSHLGIEWDLTSATAAQRAEVAAWVSLHKRFRELLHSGRVVRSDHPDPDLWVHGTVGQDRREAVYAVVSLRHRAWTRPGRVRLPGLAPEMRYRLTVLEPASAPATNDTSAAPWITAAPLDVLGSVLTEVGVEVPSMFPEQLLLVHVESVP